MERKTIVLNGTTYIDNRLPYCFPEDDEFQTAMQLGFPFHMYHNDQRSGYPAMFRSYIKETWHGSAMGYKWTGANKGNDEVHTINATSEEAHRAYCKECKDKYEKEQAKK